MYVMIHTDAHKKFAKNSDEVLFNIFVLGYVTSTHNMNRDWARYPLFTHFDEEKIFTRDTYKGRCKCTHLCV